MDHLSLVGIVPWEFVAQIANLLIQAALFKKFLFKPVQGIIAKRRGEVNAIYGEAEAARTAAEEEKAEYDRLMREDHNTVRGRVSSAVPLTETQLTVLAARMGETLGKHVLLEGTVSPSLIGGIRVEIDGRVWDGSLRGRLEELSGLLRGAVL